MLFEQRVKLYELQLNDTDDDIIEYIRKHRNNLIHIPIKKITEELYIAPNSIMRLSRKLGYSGFAELKFAIQNEDTVQENTISSQVLKHLPDNIVRTLDTIDEGLIEKAASWMYESGCCIFAGVGDSTYFCEMLGKNLRCLERNVQYYQQIHDMQYAVRHGSKQDLLIIISARGKNERLLELAGMAKSKGMKIISISHFCKNPLADGADLSLYFWGEDRMVNGYNVTDRSGLMVLVRLLSEAFWRRYGQ